MEGTQAPEQIIINGQSYNSEDATSLIELGNKYKKIESDLNTSLDKVYPEYSRLSNEKKAWLEERKELEALRTAKTEAEEAARKTSIPDETQKARKAARDLGLADEDFLKEKGYMTRSEMDDYFSQKQALQRQTDEVLAKTRDLEAKIDGSDGRVPFDQKAVLAYQNAYGISDPMDAYEQMNERANKKWKDAQIEKEQRPGLTTLKPGGGKKEPQRVRVTNDNLGQMLSELLDGVQE